MFASDRGYPTPPGLVGHLKDHVPVDGLIKRCRFFVERTASLGRREWKHDHGKLCELEPR
jgi:hypothetical protein